MNPLDPPSQMTWIDSLVKVIDQVNFGKLCDPPQPPTVHELADFSTFLRTHPSAFFVSLNKPVGSPPRDCPVRRRPPPLSSRPPANDPRHPTPPPDRYIPRRKPRLLAWVLDSRRHTPRLSGLCWFARYCILFHPPYMYERTRSEQLRPLLTNPFRTLIRSPD